MRTSSQIEHLLNQLEISSASELEDQDLDFKEWDFESRDSSVKLVIKMAICMANGEGGTVVFGIHDKKKGRSQAIIGVPEEVDVNLLKKAVYDSTDPKITPVFEEVRVSEGTGRLLVMQVYPGIPPYTDTSGKGTVRVGRECVPLTGTLRRKIAVETGETDFTAEKVSGHVLDQISPAAMEILRTLARKDKAPDELLHLSDLDLLDGLGLISHQHLTRGGLLIAGKPEAIRLHIPGYVWTWLKMKNDTEYSDRLDGHDALPIALERLEAAINTDNPITTLPQGLFHFEYRCYPQIALREALLNAFCHTDYRLSAPVLIKQFPDRIEISNPGGFVGGITPENILHHQPVPRNPRLVDALLKLRLVNRSNLGISRMFKALLIEGKEPPVIQDFGEAITITFYRRAFSPEFRAFVEECEEQGKTLSVDHLIVIQYLLSHAEADTAQLARQCQRTESRALDILSQMERQGFIHRGGTGRGTYWSLTSDVHARLADSQAHRARTEWEAAKAQILDILKQRKKNGEGGLSNADLRKITRYDRNQVHRLMVQLREEDPLVESIGRGKNSKYQYGK